MQFASHDAQENSRDIMNYLKVGKPTPVKEAIDKYGDLFLEEYYHFLRQHKLC